MEPLIEIKQHLEIQDVHLDNQDNKLDEIKQELDDKLDRKEFDRWIEAVADKRQNKMNTFYKINPYVLTLVSSGISFTIGLFLTHIK